MYRSVFFSIASCVALTAACASSSSDGGGSGAGGVAANGGAPSGGALGKGGASSNGTGGATPSGGSTPSGGTGTGGAVSGGTGGTMSGGSSGTGGTGTGGTGGAGTGGTGTGGTGTGGTVNHPGTCDKLPAAGTWENIFQPSNGSGAFGAGFSEALSVDPFDSAIVWLQVGYQGIYKSTDCGATFEHVNTGRNASVFDTGNHVGIYVDPIDKGVVFSCSIHAATGLYKSTNGGVDWDAVFAPDSEVAKVTGNNMDSISVDPTNHHHMVLSMHSTCQAPYDPTCEVETTDGGATWRIFKSPPGTNWEEGAGAWVINATTWLYGGLHLWLTTDRGASWKLLDPDPAVYWGLNGGEVETHPIPQGPDGTYYLTAAQGVIHSTDNGLTWSLIPNSGGQAVGFVIGGGKMFVSNQWSASMHTASATDGTKWSAITAPPIPSGQGCPYIDYDAAHHVLYASCYAAGSWRMVTN